MNANERRWVAAMITISLSLSLSLSPLIAWAASAVAPPAPSAWGGFVPMLIPLIVPILIAGLKLGIASVPGWLLPILAPILGGLADAAIAFATGGPANPMLGMVMGSAGVGVREVVDQIRKSAKSA